MGGTGRAVIVVMLALLTVGGLVSMLLILGPTSAPSTARGPARAIAQSSSSAAVNREASPIPKQTPVRNPSTTPSHTTANPAPTPIATATRVATPSPVPTSPPAANPGTGMPRGDLPGWHQIFAEDFATAVPVGSFPGPVYQSKWGVYPDGWHDTSRNG